VNQPIDERELAARLVALGCETGVTRSGRLIRVDDRNAVDPLPSPLLDEVMACEGLREITLRRIAGPEEPYLESLRRMAALQSLDLEGTGLDDAGLETLSQCSSLRVLNVRGTRVSSGQVARLRKQMLGTRIIF
jgi:hypothetical protein